MLFEEAPKGPRVVDFGGSPTENDSLSSALKVKVRELLRWPADTCKLTLNGNFPVDVNSNLRLSQMRNFTSYEGTPVHTLECTWYWTDMKVHTVCEEPTKKSFVTQDTRSFQLLIPRKKVFVTYRGEQVEIPLHTPEIPFEIQLDNPTHPRVLRHLQDHFN